MIGRIVFPLALVACALPAAAQVRTDERVDVARVLVDVRVTDGQGRPVRGLDVSHFRVDIDGRRARVESVSWVGFDGSSAGAQQESATARPEGVGELPPHRRLTVFLFQKSLEPTRIGGALQMMKESARFVDRLGPTDRAAVVLFDSRLRVWQDFTTDRLRLAEVLGRGIFFDRPDEGASDGVSLVASLNRASAERAATMEEGLTVLANALGKIDGAKSLVIFGHGFGTYTPSLGSRTGLAVLGREYEDARAALIGARVTVFAMDVTNAETHTLETGLITAAEDTGGFYMRVNEQQATAMDRLEGALEGYYLLAVESGTSRKGRHAIRVRADAPRATVSARRYYID